jgi:hypothetical protein
MHLRHDLVLRAGEGRPALPSFVEEVEIVSGMHTAQRRLVPHVGCLQLMACRAGRVEQGIDPRRHLWIGRKSPVDLH